MSSVSVNPLHAPNFEESQRNSVPASSRNGASRQASVGSLTNGHYFSKAYPSQNTYHGGSCSHEHPSVGTTLLKETSSKTQIGIDESSIVSYLQIPSSINESKGSLAEFAAQASSRTLNMALASNNGV